MTGLQDKVKELAALPPLEYEQRRQEEAEALGVRVTALDKEVKAARRSNGDNGPEDVEPWPENVAGDDLLDRLALTFRRYCVLPAHAETVLALWALYTWAYDAFDYSPRLHVRAPELRCGKTRVLNVLSVVCRRPHKSENSTTATLFRRIDRDRPTVLLDEVDGYLKEDREVRTIINSGFERGGVAERCEGDNNEIRTFATFAPLIMSGIGRLHETIEDRSIVFHLRRRRRDERISKFRERSAAAQAEELRRMARRWADDNAESLADARPELPEELDDRAADLWEPLAAIAEKAEGEWPERCRQAAVHFSRERQTDAESIRVRLLADVKEVFDAGDLSRISSKDLVEKLVAMEEAPWATFRRGDKPLTQHSLSYQLKHFRIAPKQLRIDGPKCLARKELSDFSRL